MGYAFVGEPLHPDELDRLGRIYEVARWMAGTSRHDPSAQRLAAMVIRFYQLGVKDDQVLLASILKTHGQLTGTATSENGTGHLLADPA
jgi:hypothetical protein